MGMREDYEAYLRVVSDAVNVIRNKTPGIPCGPGCWGCCKLLVGVHQLDAVVVANYLKTQGLDTPELRDALAASNALAKKYGAASGAPPEQINFDGYIKEWKSCAFLKDGKCSVYPARPYVCRTYMVVGDKKFCHKSKWYRRAAQSVVDTSIIDADVKRRLGAINVAPPITGNLWGMVLWALEQTDKENNHAAECPTNQ